MAPSQDDPMRALQDALRRAGVTLPPQHLPGTLIGSTELQAMLALLRGPRDAAAEPAVTYSLDTITRDGAA
jgi:hypothetical protein